MSDEPIPIEASLAVLTKNDDDIAAVLSLIKEIPVVGTVVNVAIATYALFLDSQSARTESGRGSASGADVPSDEIDFWMARRCIPGPPSLLAPPHSRC